MSPASSKKSDPTVIKKYANRRLYDTGRSSYVTLDDLCIMVKEGHDFVVYDAKSGNDITRQVLTQIIVDQESRGQNLLPTNFLRQLIGFYGDNLQPLVPNYLEQTMQSFVTNHQRFAEQLNKSMDGIGGMGMFPMGNLEEINKQNMAMFENAMKVFTPFSGQNNHQASSAGTQNTSSPTEDRVNELKRNIAELEKEIDKLSS